MLSESTKTRIGYGFVCGIAYIFLFLIVALSGILEVSPSIFEVIIFGFSAGFIIGYIFINSMKSASFN